MKARFTTKQPAVRWQPLDNGMVDVTICLNGQEVEEENTQMVDREQYATTTNIYWEYDFHQFREKTENINQAAVEENLEKYLYYIPVTEKPAEETELWKKMAEIEAAIERGMTV